jgi:ABA4-like protein
MYPHQIFQLCNMIAMIGWLILILLPGWYQSDKFIIGIIITLFAIVYTWLIFSAFKPADLKSFGSLDGVMNLFQNPKLVLAGWVHYLSFDLLTGLFIKKNSLKHGINHWIIVPCLLLTFMLGPAGLLLYLLIRLVITKSYFAENY